MFNLFFDMVNSRMRKNESGGEKEKETCVLGRMSVGKDKEQ